MPFHDHLIKLLKAHQPFVDEEGELVFAAVQDSAWKMDHALMRLLLADAQIKQKFFDEIT